MSMSMRSDWILLADDDPAVRTMLTLGLERGGLVVQAVASGREAIEVISGKLPGVLVLDAVMPGLDGFETCRRVRTMARCERLPILMLTSLDDDASIARAYDVGATDFFIKAPQITLLVERLRYMLRSTHAQEELRRSRETLTKAQRIARLGSWEWGLVSHEISCSDECQRILNVDSQGAVRSEKAFAAALAECAPAALRDEMMLEIRSQGSFRREFTLNIPAQGMRHLQVEAELDESDRTGEMVIHGTLQDITEHRRTEAHVRQLANFDGLTGLPNRHQFRERLSQVLEQARGSEQRLALLFIDLDRFKVVNDTLGHTAGDQLLREVAGRLSSCIRGGTRGGGAPELGNVARLGGDEFTILLPELRNKDDAAQVASRIVAALRQPFIVLGTEFWISASVGIATFPDDGSDAETLLMRADSAMHHVKAQGKNGHSNYTPSLDSRGLELFRMEADLRKALSRDELRLFYQPIVSVNDGRIIGAEALMRWQRGDRLESPADFIPLAEDTGLIIPMGEWAIHEACRQASAWQNAQSDPFYVAVNISGNHFQQRNLIPTVQVALQESGLPASSLQIEITETVAMQTVEATRRTLARAREIGIRLAIDDFGTGYSSLAYLKRLPIDTLKIDRSFIKDIARQSDDEAIISAIIGLARSLGLSIVAEGVETDTQLAFLNMFGATLMQGYLFAKPLPAPDFWSLLQSNARTGGNASWKSPERSRVMHLFDASHRRTRAAPVDPAPTVTSAAG